MKYTPDEVTQYVREEDVKFIRMAFCDVYGRHKNVAVQAEELERAFSSGVPVDGSAIAGFGGAVRPDLLLHPDPSTLIQLPWRPQHGKVAHMFCDITHGDGTPFEADTRRILKEALNEAEQAGYAFDFGSEMEFYLMKLDEYGEPAKIPYDQAGYMDVAPLDRGENIRREICLTLEQMGIQPERSLHKMGPGQNEIDFRFADALAAADSAVLFRTMVRTVAAQNGLWADFSPKPFPDEEGNGMHLNISVRSGGSDPLPQMIAGLLALAPEMTVFLNPSEQSYERLSSAASLIGWSRGSRSFLLRVPGVGGQPAANQRLTVGSQPAVNRQQSAGGRRVELRSPDSLCNPYLAFALVIYASLYGIRHNLPLPEAAEFHPASASPETLARYRRLPASLQEAAEIAKKSAFILKRLPASVITAYCRQEPDGVRNGT